MFERLKAAAKAFAIALPGPSGAAAKAFFGNHPAALNFPNSAVQAGGGKKMDLAGIINNLPISHLRDYESYLFACSRKVWAAWKAGDIVSKIVQETPRTVLRVGADGKPGGDPIIHPELSPVLIQANPFETFNELLARAVFHLKFTGNVFIAKDQTDMNGDRPKALYLLNPRRVILALDRNSQIAGYTYIVGNGRSIPFDVKEVIHVKLPHPDRDYWGLGEIEAGEDLYNDFINRQTWLEKFWQNGASPSGILFNKDSQITDQDAWDRAKAKWQKEYGGAENSGKTAWLTGDWDYLQMGLTAQEMQSIENSTWSVEQIFILAGIPLSVAGVKDAANYATANVDEIRMRRYTVKPLVSNLEDKLNSGLVRGYDPTLALKFSVQGLIDIDASSKSVPLLVGAGIMSPNDAREYIGLERRPDPALDEFYIQSSLVPISLSGLAQTTGPDQQQAEAVVKRFVEAYIDERGQLPPSPRRRQLQPPALAKPHDAKLNQP